MACEFCGGEHKEISSNTQVTLTMDDGSLKFEYPEFFSFYSDDTDITYFPVKYCPYCGEEVEK